MATDLYEISGLCVDVEYMVMGVLANNVYIVSDGEGTMVVDPSCSVDKILAALGDRKLDAIVLTHSHFDHTGGVAELCAALPRVPVYLHPADAALVGGDVFPAVGAESQVVHSLAKWKRYALKRYNFYTGKGLVTDMNAIRRDESLDNIHSVYVDQWDWEKIIRREDRTLAFLQRTAQDIVDAICDTSEIGRAHV